MSTFKTAPGIFFPLAPQGRTGIVPGALTPGNLSGTTPGIPGPCMMGGPGRSSYEVQRTSTLAQQLSRPPAAVHRIQPAVLGIASVREKIKESGLRFDEEQVQKMEERFVALHNRLLGMAAAMGRDVEITLEFEPTEPTAAMKLEKPRIFRIGANVLLQHSTEQLISIAMHEGAHAEISGVGSGEFFKNEMLLALFNVLEDIRANARVGDRAPGRAEEFQEDCHEIYKQAYEQLSVSDLAGELLPHEAFLEGIIGREYGTTSRWEKHPIVGPAIHQVWAAVQEAKSLRPDVDAPSDAVREHLVLAFEDVVRRKILPIYKRLFQMSTQVLQQRMQQGACQCGGESSTSEGGKSSSGGSKASSARDDGTSSSGQPRSPQGGAFGSPQEGGTGEGIRPGARDVQQGAVPSPQHAPAAGGASSDAAQGAASAVGRNAGESPFAEHCPSCGGHRMTPEEMARAIEQTIKERAEAISKIHAPKGTQGERQERAKKLMGEGEPGKKASGNFTVGDPQAGKRALEAAEASEDRTVGGTMAQALQLLFQDASDHKAHLMHNPYSEFLSQLGGLPNQVFQVFDQLLKPNGDFEFDGYFTSGPRIDVERAVRAVNGMLTSLGVFERKIEPDSRTYRFSLLIDSSGSMMEPESERGGLGMAALFMDVFERLDLPYSLDAFHDHYIPVKGFERRVRTVAERNELFKKFILSSWGMGGTNIREGIQGTLRRIREARRKEPREQEFLFVLTDGAENMGGGKSIRQLSEEVAKEGIIIVGIGIGAGMLTVEQHFPVHLVESNPLNLPKLLSEFIKEYVKMTIEEDW